jgi:hypothetical protein
LIAHFLSKIISSWFHSRLIITSKSLWQKIIKLRPSKIASFSLYALNYSLLTNFRTVTLLVHISSLKTWSGRSNLSHTKKFIWKHGCCLFFWSCTRQDNNCKEYTMKHIIQCSSFPSSRSFVTSFLFFFFLKQWSYSAHTSHIITANV